MPCHIHVVDCDIATDTATRLDRDTIRAVTMTWRINRQVADNQAIARIYATAAHQDCRNCTTRWLEDRRRGAGTHEAHLLVHRHAVGVGTSGDHDDIACAGCSDTLINRGIHTAHRATDDVHPLVGELQRLHTGHIVVAIWTANRHRVVVVAERVPAMVTTEDERINAVPTG